MKAPQNTPPLSSSLLAHDPDFVDRLIPFFEPLKRYFRYEVKGLELIPKNKASLVVMNHGVIPFHGFLLTKQLIEKRGIYPRGLAARFLFTLPYIRAFFLKGGAVNASPRNARALLTRGDCVLLAPGGIYEALICHPGMKRIPWERRKGFIRIAVETHTPIIPTFCKEINEIYFNSKFLLKFRIKILEATRFSLPLFLGLGLFPLPYKLIHHIGKPLSVKAKKGENRETQINRIHHEVIKAMNQLALQASSFS